MAKSNRKMHEYALKLFTSQDNIPFRKPRRMGRGVRAVLHTIPREIGKGNQIKGKQGERTCAMSYREVRKIEGSRNRNSLSIKLHLERVYDHVYVYRVMSYLE